MLRRGLPPPSDALRVHLPAAILLVGIAVLGASRAGAQNDPNGGSTAGERSSSLQRRVVIVDQAKITVNDRLITQREANDLLGLRRDILRRRLRGEALEQALAELPARIETELIQTLLLEERAATLQIEIDETRIDRRLEQLLQEQPGIEQVYSEHALRSLLLRELLRQEVLQREVFSRLLVREEDVIAACEQAQAAAQTLEVGHLLLRLDAATSEAEEERVRARSEALYRLISTGDISFEEAAKEHSEDPSTAASGGKLGQIRRGQFLTSFEDVAFSLSAGQVSTPLRTPLGYHLIKLYRRVTAADATSCTELDEGNRLRIEQEVRAQKREQALRDYLEDLRSKADITVFSR